MSDLLITGGRRWPTKTPEEYRGMAESVNEYRRQDAAEQWGQNCPLNILQVLAKDSEESVRVRIAANTSTPASILEELSGDTCEQVRMKVARHHNTPESVRDKLLKDESWSVRMIASGEEV